MKKKLFELAETSLGFSNFSKEEWKAVRALANGRSIIKKADKGSCMVVWDRNDDIAVAEKQLSDENIYKDVNFKDKILQELTDNSNKMFKSLKMNWSITEKELKHFTIELTKASDLGDCIYYLKFISVWKMFQVGQLFQTVTLLQKKLRNF